MDTDTPKLRYAPIFEAVLDIVRLEGPIKSLVAKIDRIAWMWRINTALLAAVLFKVFSRPPPPGQFPPFVLTNSCEKYRVNNNYGTKQ